MKEWLINLSLKKQIFILAILGYISSFSFAPYYQLWILFISLPLFIFLLFYSTNYKESFVLGYVFGFFFFLGGLYWIANSLLVDIESYLYLIPLAIIMIPAILALYISVLAIFLHYFNNKHSLRFFILFVCAWVMIEISRTYLFTGFPWLALGYSLMFKEYLIQSSSIFGVFGLSLIVVCCGGIPFLLIHINKKNIVLTLCIFIVCIANIIFGIQRLKKSPTEYYDYYVNIIQPNISQQDKINSDKFVDNLNRLVFQTTQPKGYISESGYILWPETALGHYYKLPVVKNIISNIVPPNHYLITGVERSQDNKVYNSVMAYNDMGEVVAYYDKSHLVPFGEYLPLRKLFPEYMYNISNGLIDFESGDGPYTIALGDLPSFGPLICYESLFPEGIVNDKNRPQFLINFTNDAWYGNTSGPYQHFEMTRLRAVEYGMAMVRVSNTGISAVIDSYGRIKSYLSLNTSGVIQKKIPLPLKCASIFSKMGNSIIIILVMIMIFGALFFCRDQDI
jgi:apolipoprotein N-acyltransferase